MRTDRRYLLELVASGRISAAQAERLLAAWSADRETLWAFAGCSVLAGLAQVQTSSLWPGLGSMARSLFIVALPAVHHALNFILTSIGGTL